MLQLSVIGNLGADAERKNKNGSEFVTFRVAHSEVRNDVEVTNWISCVLPGDGGNLFNYLKRGVKVFVSGALKLRTYTSTTTHQIEAALDCRVQKIELCGQVTNEESVKKFLNENKEIAAKIINELPF